eukprot:jgi/Tetstr1/434257/TSEL_023364.t1
MKLSDGVQHGAFHWPRHSSDDALRFNPKVEECDYDTLNATYWATRFNANEFLVGPWEHVCWLALLAFCTTIKVSVGLELRFDKMHAYIAGMEVARRGVPADIEWLELDGHHGIHVLNVPPLGSPGYAHAYMRGKAEELYKEVDDNLSKLLSAKQAQPSLDAVSGMWTVTILTDRKGAIADAFRDQCVHDLGIAVRREVDDMFQHSASCWQRYTHPRDEL